MRGENIWKKLNLFFILILICIFGVIYISFKTEAGIFPDEMDDDLGYSSVLYNSDNGLPTSEANTIVQSSDGFIWIGSYGGLIRYDGNEFYQFDSTTGITSVECLFVDSQDRLWVGTNDSGIALYENGDFTFFGTEEGLGSDSIRVILEDNEGNIIVATTCGIVYIDSALEVHNIENENISQEYINDMDVNDEGKIVGITLEGDLFIIEELEVTEFYEMEELDCPDVRSVDFNSQDSDEIYLGTEENCIIKIDLSGDLSEYETIDTGELSCINQILVTSDENIWICSDDGIGYIDTDENLEILDEVYMNNSVENMLVDYEGNLWFVSSRQGVMKIVPNQFFDISQEADLPEMVVNATCKYMDNLYVGSDSGLYIIDEDDQKVENELTEKLDGVRIRCIYEDSEKNLWICTYGDTGLIKYDKDGNITSINTENGLNSDKVRDIIESSDGDLVVATNGGVNIIRDDDVVESYGADDGITNTAILTVCEGSDGVIYAGSDGGGIYAIEDGEISCIDESDGLESSVILRIKQDPNNDRLWIITSNSIAYLNDGIITNIDNFPYSNNFDIFFSDMGAIWILSGNGIYVVSEEEEMSELDLNYTFYNSDDGMPSNVTANSRNYLDVDGTLYIAGSSNVFSININDSDESEDQIKIAVPYVEIDGEIKYIEDGETLEIPSNCKRLEIYGYVLTYSLQNPIVEYRLEGFEDEYVTTTKTDLGTVIYTNLNGGYYKFILEVMSEDGTTINNSIEITIHKEKTFGETAWFIAIIIAVIVMIILIFFSVMSKIKNRILIKKQEEASMFIQQVICSFAKVIDGKDEYTNGHSSRVAEYSALIAQEYGYEDEHVVKVYNIALLHDIGKISIPDAILNKRERLTDDEYIQMKNHTISGDKILSEITIFPEMSLGAKFHHEKLDGSGYPLGLKKEEIPEIARIIAVADTFDAMYSTRPYRKKLSINVVMNEMMRVAGTQLDETFVKIMIELIKKGMIKIDPNDSL